MSFEYISIANKTTPFKLNDMQVFFTDEKCFDVIKTVLDKKVNILNFPGIVKDERWTDKHKIGNHTDVRFEARFCTLENDKYLEK